MYVMNPPYNRYVQAVSKHFMSMAESDDNFRRRRTLIATSMFLDKLSKIEEPYNNFTNRLLELVNEMHEYANSNEPITGMYVKIAEKENAVTKEEFKKIDKGT